MNCTEFRNILNEKLGTNELRAIDDRHIKECPDCRQYYRELLLLSDGLSELSIRPMSTLEFAAMQGRLDRRISGYLNRAVGFYRFMVRYGIVFSTFILIFFMSVWQNIPLKDEQFVDESNQSTSLYFDDYLEAAAIDDDYIDLVIDDFSNKFNSYSGDILIGDLEDDEYQYLLENINAEGLL